MSRKGSCVSKFVYLSLQGGKLVQLGALRPNLWSVYMRFALAHVEVRC